MIDPADFYDSCVFDTCAFMGDDRRLFCEALEAYAELCRMAGGVLPHDYKTQIKCGEAEHKR